MPLIKLHLDTDIGGDIDDLCALAMVLQWPGVELLAVTTNSDDRGRRAGYARYVLNLAGRSTVPVAAGADVALECYRVHPGLPDEAVYWPEPIPPSPAALEEALDLLERSIEAGAIIAAIGPYTNLALLEKRTPGILQRANLYLMGGYVFPPRDGFPPWDYHEDWNVQVDVQSALFVLQNSNPTLIPLSVTVETALRRADLQLLRQSGPLGQLIARQSEAFAQEYNNEARYGQTCPGLPDDTINFQHDPLACAIGLGWEESVEIRELPLVSTIKDGWLVQKVDDSGSPARLVTRVNGAQFNDLWLKIVTRQISL